ncbi:MAG: hypothetical protein QOC60_100 [Frankiaceae bacterium]|jgi:hypothetical protein|nr:hypothetical protein [Frankiaceae bacterium]
MATVVVAAVALAPSDRVTGSLSAADKVGIYRVILDDRSVFASAARPATPLFLVDAKGELSDSDRAGLTLWHPGKWLPLDDVDVRAALPGSVLVEVLYPAKVANGRVEVQLAEMCGHRCGSGTSYVLIRAGAGWRIIDQQTLMGA